MIINDCGCGGMARHYWYTERAGGKPLHYIQCGKCETTFGTYHDTEEISIISWNEYQKSIIRKDKE